MGSDILKEMSFLKKIRKNKSQLYFRSFNNLFQNRNKLLKDKKEKNNLINAQIPSIENAIIALFFTSHILYNSIMCHVAYVCILVVVVVVGGIGKHALLHPLHHNSPSWREREREREYSPRLLIIISRLIVFIKKRHCVTRFLPFDLYQQLG